MGIIAEWNIEGKWDNSYTFEVYDLDSVFLDDSGVYIFSKREPNEDGTGTHTILYIGSTNSFKLRIHKSHKKWDEALDKGMNAISIYPIEEPHLRRKVERELIEEYQPPLNLRS